MERSKEAPFIAVTVGWNLMMFSINGLKHKMEEHSISKH